MKTLKRIFSLIFAALTVLLILCSCTSSKKADNIPDPTDEFYVYDEAEVLDRELEEYIIGKNADLYEKCGGQIVVAFVKTTGAEDIAGYAYDMFNKWKIGSSEKNNGVLILVSVEEDDYWALQGYGLENLMQSGTLKLMLDDNFEPYFAKKQYNAAVRYLFDAFISEFEQIYSISVANDPDAAVNDAPEISLNTEENEKTGFWGFVSLVSAIIVGFTGVVIAIIIIVILAIAVFAIITSFLGSGSGSAPRGNTFRGGINVNPRTFRTTGTFRGGSFGGFKGGSSGGFKGGSFGGFKGGLFGGFKGGSSGGSHHSGGGGFSRGGGAGRR